MGILVTIIFATFLISLTAFVGALTLFFKKQLIDKILLIFVSFSAGALMGGAFLHLLPKAILKVGFNSSAILDLFLFFLLGFCVFFVLEQFIRWHHCHSTNHKIKPVSYLILIGDAIHNFIDGLVIAASFAISFSTGVTTTLAIALHEIPQEIGDFGLLIYGGFDRKKALLFNFASALTVVLGGIVGYGLYALMDTSIVFLLPFAAGNFVYIASSDLIPEIKHKDNTKESVIHFIAFVFGISLMFGVKFLF